MGDKQSKMCGLGGSGVANCSLNGVAWETDFHKPRRRINECYGMASAKALRQVLPACLCTVKNPIVASGGREESHGDEI